jgi:LysR family transcriptional regulator for bpeEF and oprC
MDRLWAMEVFVRVVECGSFSKAAASLDLANATVTACVRNLEKHLGVTLIQRNTRHLYLTDEGTLFFPRCQEVLHSVERAESEVSAETGEVRGALRVEMPISIGHALICPALSLFAKRHPQVSLSVNLTNQPHNLIEHAIDIAIRMDRVEEADLVARPVYETRYVVCGAPDLVRDLPAHPSELKPELCLGILTEGRHGPSDWLFRQGNEQVLIPPKGPLNFNSSDALVNTALQGTGLIYVLDIFVNRRIAAGELVQVYSDWSTSTRTFYAVTAKTQYVPPKVRGFIDFLLETLDAQQRPSARRLVEVKRAKGRR